MVIESQFSEFSYGYALTEHYVRLLRPHALFAPRFPTLRRERSLGYDVRISGFGFFQFKRANGHDGPGIMERPSGFGFPRSSVVYRMPLSATGTQNQHEKMCRLEALVGNRASVFYACPAFARSADFNTAYIEQSIPDHSMFVRPAAIGSLPSGRHHVSFNASSLRRGFAWCFSDPVRVASTPHSEVERYLRGQSRLPPVSIEALGQLAGDVSVLFANYGYEMPELPHEPRPFSRLLLKLTVMLRAGFDIEPLFIGPALRLPQSNIDKETR